MSEEFARARTAMIALGGVAAVVGLYWDDAWHTDVGRDDLFSPPHLLLYAGVATLLLAAAWWALARVRRDGWPALRDPVLLLPLGGAAVTLASAPVDDLWHELFGRDAVVWSPPHMVAVAGMLAFAAGLFLAIHRDQRRPHPFTVAVVGAFLIAAAVTVVMEFEADVPQFPVVTYLPVTVAALTFSFALIRRASDRTWAVTAAAAVYVALRVAVVGFLGVLGHSLPTVMPTVAAAWVIDLGVRGGWSRNRLATAIAAATVVSHALAHAALPHGLRLGAADLVVGLLLGSVLSWLALAAFDLGRRRTDARPAPVAGVAAVVIVSVMAGPAFAHDPGQGEEVAEVVLEARRDGDTIELRVDGEPDACGGWEPDRVVARRAGRTVEAPLVRDGACTYTGALTVDDPGRWFVYAELTVSGHAVEAWLPVDAAHQDKDTALYVASPPGTSTTQVIAGTGLYALVAAILAAVVVTYRRLVPQVPPSPPRRPEVAPHGR